MEVLRIVGVIGGLMPCGQMLLVHRDGDCIPTAVQEKFDKEDWLMVVVVCGPHHDDINTGLEVATFIASMMTGIPLEQINPIVLPEGQRPETN